MGSTSIGKVLVRDGKGHTEALGRWPRKARAGIGVTWPQMEETQKALGTGGSRDGVPWQGLRKELAPPTPSRGTSGSRNRETVNACGSKPPNLWYFVTAALGNR